MRTALVFLLSFLSGFLAFSDVSALETVSSPTTAQKGYVTRWYTEGYWPTTNAYFTLTGSLSVRSKVIGVAPYFQYGVGTGTVSTMATPNQLATCSNNCVNLSSSCTIGSGHHQAVTNRVFGDVYLAEVWFKYGNCSANSNQGASGVVRVLYNAVTQQVLHHTSSNSVFYAYRNGFFQLVALNGNNLDYYRMESDLTWTLLGSVAKPATFQAPATPPQYLDTDAFSDGTTQPSFFYLAANNGQYLFLPYNDSSPVVVRLDTGEYSTNSFWDSFKQYFGWSSETDAIPDLYGKRPYGVVEPADDNFLVLSHSTASGTSLLAQSVSVHFHFMPETSLMGVASFDNPKMYLARLNGTYAVWDVACVEPGYDICASHPSGGFKCQNALGNLGPNAISCNAPLDFQAYDPGSGGGDPPPSGTGWTSGGSGLTPVTLSGGTVEYVSENQLCVPTSFSGTTTFETSVSELNPASCAWRVVNSAYRCQTSDGYQCVVSGDSCLPQIDNPSQYASGSVVYSGDVTKYDCWTTNGHFCTWSSVSSCGPASTCYADGDFCRVLPNLVPQVPVVNGQTGSTNSVSFPDIVVPGEFNVGGVSGVGTVWTGTGSFSGSIGTSYGTGVVVEDAVKKTCRMFAEDGSFLYRGNGTPFFLGFDLMTLSDNALVKNYLLHYLQKAQGYALEPFNLVLGLTGVMSTVPDGAQICFLGQIYEIEYQAYVAPDANPVSTFHALDAYKIQKGDKTFADYLALFAFSLFYGIWIYAMLKPSSSE